MKDFTDKTELLTYIKQAIDIESNKLSQQNLIKEYYSNSEERKPQLVLQTEPRNELADGDDTCKVVAYLMFAFAGVIIVISIGMCMAVDCANPEEFWPMVLSMAAICIAIGIPCYRHSANRIKEHETAVQRVRKNNESLQVQYDYDMQIWQASNDEAYAYFSKPLAETQAVLERIYAADVIYPKYRTLPALTSIYEYLITGRCEELTGPHGAYNLYEDELRKDTIISQMNLVVQNLEQIKANQYMLYEQVQKIQTNTQAALYELQSIRGYTADLTDLAALSAYYSRINASNTRALTYCYGL